MPTTNKMDEKLKHQIQKYRHQTWLPNKKITKFEDAVNWVNQMGFVFFWPIKGVEFPSLWQAVAGDRPVTYNDPANFTWDWKDRSLSMKVWYYAKLVRRKATFVSLDVATSFYALSPNYGDPETDHLEQYRQGKMTLAAKNIYEAILTNGPLNTIDLKKVARLSSAQAESEFNKAIESLQVEMKVLPVGIAQAGAWRYSFIYDITANHYPQIVVDAGKITEQKAMLALTEIYLKRMGAANAQSICRFFNWQPSTTEKTIVQLKNNGVCSEAPSTPGLYFYKDLKFAP